MEVCRKCGAPLKDGDKFCSKCGARVRRPSSRYEERRKRKEQKTVTFRTKPEKDTGYRENFEEGENRRSALTGTVLILLIMAGCVAAFAFFFFFQGSSVLRLNGSRDEIRIISGKDSEQEAGTADGAGADVQQEAGTADGAGADVQQEAGTADGSGADAKQEAESAGEAGADAQQASGDASLEESAKASDSEKDPEDDAAAEKSSEAEETETGETEETSSEPQTEVPSPSAADVIDPERLESEIISGSTASEYEIYIYDLKHDSEASLGDCTQAMYASALITVPILYTAASLVDAGQLSMDTQVTYVTSIGGRGEYTTEARDGLDFPLSFFLQTMTHYSDNNCINTLIDFLTLDTINTVCREAGYDSVNLERKLVSGDTRGLDNYVSAKDISLMVRDLYQGRFRSVDDAWMEEYFHIDAGDSLPTLFGLASGMKGAVVLNQNGHGDTRYNETALIRSGNSVYVLTVMLYGSAGFSYNPAVTNIADYVNTAMTQDTAA